MSKKTTKNISYLALILAGQVFAGDIIDNISAYHNNSKWQKQSAKETFDYFSKKHHLKGNETLLDVCSGDGKISHIFFKKTTAWPSHRYRYIFVNG